MVYRLWHSHRQAVACCLLSLLLLSASLQPCSARRRVRRQLHKELTEEEQEDASIAGPVVKASEQATAGDASGASQNNTDQPKTIAQIIDDALVEEFPEEKQEAIGKNYNETAKQADAKVETVIKVSQNKPKPAKEGGEGERERAGKEGGGGGKEKLDTRPNPPGSPNPAKPKERMRIEANVEKEVDRIIDAQDNEYVLSRPKAGAFGLTLDPQLIRDLTVLITSSTVAGMALEAVQQPIINGYFIAGSLVGPGGLGLIKELVQVESLAQVGVQLLLFTLGLEFSLAKLRAVRSVALLGGMIEILLFIVVAGFIAKFTGASVHEGIFIGALVSMSSTSIVVKCLTDAHATTSPHGQITIGTLILQDCMVGLLFAFMPVLANNGPGEEQADEYEVAGVVFRVTGTLLAVLAAATLVSRTLLPPAMRLLGRTASAELFQLTVLALCLMSAWLTGHLGLSTELGAFIAGVMLSATDQQENCLHQLEHLKHFFLSLFVSSTGLVMSPRFLLQHLPVLTGGVVLCITAKTVLISGVVWLFRYPLRTALAVGLSMAQIGEFAFVLLSAASQLGLMAYQVYMLLMGVTALSLLLTPFLLQASSRWLLMVDTEATPVLRALRAKHRVTDDSDSPVPAPEPAEGGPRSTSPFFTRDGGKAGGAATTFASEAGIRERGQSFL